MDSIANIPIKYYNRTGDIDFEVMVYAKNYAPRYPSDYELAWRVLRGQGSVGFNYPRKMQVGARYEYQNQTIKCGPIDAEPGTTWEIIHENPNDTAVLRRGRNE